MPDRIASLRPVTDDFANAVRQCRYGLVIQGDDGPRLQAFETVGALAGTLAERRRGRSVKGSDAALVWGEGEGEARAAIHLSFHIMDAVADETVTAICWAESPMRLAALVTATRVPPQPAARAA